jgi:hypothetical protein
MRLPDVDGVAVAGAAAVSMLAAAMATMLETSVDAMTRIRFLLAGAATDVTVLRGSINSPSFWW